MLVYNVASHCPSLMSIVPHFSGLVYDIIVIGLPRIFCNWVDTVVGTAHSLFVPSLARIFLSSLALANEGLSDISSAFPSSFAIARVHKFSTILLVRGCFGFLDTTHLHVSIVFLWAVMISFADSDMVGVCPWIFCSSSALVMLKLQSLITTEFADCTAGSMDIIASWANEKFVSNCTQIVMPIERYRCCLFIINIIFYLI